LILCALGVFFAVASVLDVTGFRGEPPWAGRWGAYFAASGKQYVRVLSVDPSGPAERADLRAGDLIDVSKNALFQRYWQFYRAPNAVIIDLWVSRASQRHPFSVRLVTGSTLSIFGYLPIDLGVLFLLIYAGHIAWRSIYRSQYLVFSTVLILLGVGILCDPVRFGTPWWALYPVLSVFNMAYPLSIALWARLAGSFAQPPSLSRRIAENACYAFVAGAIAVDFAQMISILVPWHPAELLYGWASYSPIGAAIMAGLVCTSLAISASSPRVRRQAYSMLVPLSLLYSIALANAVTQRVSKSFALSHTFLIVENVVFLITVGVIIYLSLDPDAVIARGKVLARVRSIRVSPRTILTFLVSIIGIAAIGWFIVLIVQQTFAHTIEISTLSVPGDFANEGFSATVESVRLRDEVNGYTKAAWTELQPDVLSLPAEDPAVVVPELNLPVDYIAETFATLFHLYPRQHVSGEITGTATNVQLRLRLNDQLVFKRSATVSGRAAAVSKVDEMLKAAPACLLNKIQPFFVAAHLYNDQNLSANKRLARAESVAGKIANDPFLASNDANKILSRLLLATMFFNRGDLKHAEFEIETSPQLGNGTINHTWRGDYFLNDDSDTYFDPHKTDKGLCKGLVFGGALSSRDPEAKCSRGDYDEYQELYELNVALDRDPRYPMALDYLGQVYQTLGEHDQFRDRARMDRENEQANKEYDLAIRYEPDRAFHKESAEALALEEAIEAHSGRARVVALYDKFSRLDHNDNFASDISGIYAAQHNDVQAEYWSRKAEIWVSAERPYGHADGTPSSLLEGEDSGCIQ
jgi:tetratricopeptide (TPR) repeat protein